MLRRSRPEQLLNVTRSVQYPNHLNRLGLMAINNQIGINEQKFVPAVRQFFPPMPHSRILCDVVQCLLNCRQHTIRGFSIIGSEVFPDFVEITACQPRKNE